MVYGAGRCPVFLCHFGAVTIRVRVKSNVEIAAGRWKAGQDRGGSHSSV